MWVKKEVVTKAVEEKMTHTKGKKGRRRVTKLAIGINGFFSALRWSLGSRKRK